MRCAALVLLATGCRGLLGIEEGVVAEDAPAARDGDAGELCATWQPRLIEACALDPAPSLVITAERSPYTLDTGRRLLTDRNGATIELAPRIVTQSDQSELLAIAVDELAIEAAARLNVIGTRPLLIASYGSIAVAGVIDAGSHAGRIEPGAGANTRCSAPAMTGGTGATGGGSGGSGGGGGGALRGTGGAGGRGGVSRADGGAGGASLPMPAVVRGGCAGGSSGMAGSAAVFPASQASVALGGAGGGAVYLAARQRIEIGLTGFVLAGGAGGEGAKLGSMCGGGGGGSGGYIGLEAPAVSVSGVIAANGGGGGGSAPSSDKGEPGEDGRADKTQASGGPSKGGCSPGARGAADETSGAPPGSDNTACGGGGGGGGGGAVMVWSPAYDATGTAKISPPATENQP